MDALVIGAGPAGLMAAEALAAVGHKVLVAEAKPSPARKFLMAGKSGLNITHAGANFNAAFDAPWLAPMLHDFGPSQVQEWCRDLGQELFTGSSGRVFPVAMKASPLLRAWLGRLSGAGVDLRTRWRWTGFEGENFAFDTPDGRVAVKPTVTVLALGGASWARLGSDAAWVPMLESRGVKVTPFQPANMGFGIDWSAHMARHFGQPIKGAALCLSNGPRERGEFVVSAKGLEGGGIYAISRDLRQGASLHLDLMPDLAPETIRTRLAKGRRGDSVSARLRKLGLSPVAVALVQEWGRPLPDDLAILLKALPVPLAGPRPLDEAISSAGGIAQEALTEGLELRALSRVFVCGEMLDWEAPTGGYLLTACLATGLWAGRAAA
ncbi:TIGR03862 family flavoprotein [Pseudorhodobacter turbinis]|uniref:TIGR03862 family flavoprotein n=1 Tax=Pseudorhodobacter turbinis TaxID=2500533 RepID=A0A4P8EIB6_9RHOB|nr:TIGR03862 family flavoprotein [Pseudorhodobacter turbinis]QCO56562.1 TIGR03862 family flavoprotein [Pseudorhodobacter turbinis]